MSSGLSSQLDLLRDAERVVDLDPKVADCAFELRMTQQSCAIIRIRIAMKGVFHELGLAA